jgi:hypothetical protein
VDGTLPDGYLQAVSPGNNVTGVSVGLANFTVWYNQPMDPSKVGNKDRYDLYQEANPGKDIHISSATYNPADYSVVVDIDPADSNWLPGAWYQIKVKANAENACGQGQGAEVITRFRTADPTPTSTPTLSGMPGPQSLLFSQPVGTGTPVATGTALSLSTPTVTAIPPATATPTTFPVCTPIPSATPTSTPTYTPTPTRTPTRTPAPRHR